MKPLGNIPTNCRLRGIMLIECMVYIAVYAVLLGGGMTAFYLCWDHSKAVMYATSDITAAMRAGEYWRDDVRTATGTISVMTTTNSEIVRIPEAGKEVVYRFSSGEVSREIPGSANHQLLLPMVKSSAMTPELRGSVDAWRWELELTGRRKEARLPLLFTFETVQPKP